jgi:phosphatidylglycerophosphate synthase
VSTEAVLYLPASRDAATALDTVAGRPLGFRMLMAALRAGCSRVWVPAQFRGGPIERAIDATPSARAASVWLQPGAAPPAGPVLLLSATALASPATLRPLLTARPPALLGGSWEDGAPVVVVGGDRVPTIWSRLTSEGPMGDTLTEALSTGEVTIIPSEGWRVPAPAPVRELERRLFGDLGSPVDTRLDTILHRRLSRPITRLAVAAGVSPNVVSVASLLVGLLAAVCFGHGTPAWAMLGLLLYVSAVALDHADGEVARLTFAESRFGARLDVIVDTVVHAAIMLALGLATGGLGVLGGVLAAIGAVMSAALTQTSPTTSAGGGGRVLEALSNRDGFYAMLLAFIGCLTFLPSALPTLMLIVAAGTHAFWLGQAVSRLRWGA